MRVRFSYSLFSVFVLEINVVCLFVSLCIVFNSLFYGSSLEEHDVKRQTMIYKTLHKAT